MKEALDLAYKNNSTFFWKYVQRKLKTPTGISSLLDGNALVTSEKDKASLKNTYFSMVYSKKNMSNHPVVNEAVRSNGSTLSDVVTTPKAIEKNFEC